MTPATATAPSPARRGLAAGAPARRPEAAPVRRTSGPPDPRQALRVVPAPPGTRRRRIPETLAVVMLVGSLLAVVMGHAMLTSGTVRLSTVQARVTAEQAVHRQEVLKVARLETPSRIVAEAEQQLHMVPPASVDQLPWVALGKPLDPPNLAAPPRPATAPGAPSSGQ